MWRNLLACCPKSPFVYQKWVTRQWQAQICTPTFENLKKIRDWFTAKAASEASEFFVSYGTSVGRNLKVHPAFSLWRLCRDESIDFLSDARPPEKHEHPPSPCVDSRPMEKHRTGCKGAFRCFWMLCYIQYSGSKTKLNNQWSEKFQNAIADWPIIICVWARSNKNKINVIKGIKKRLMWKPILASRHVGTTLAKHWPLTRLTKQDRDHHGRIQSVNQLKSPK